MKYFILLAAAAGLAGATPGAAKPRPDTPAEIATCIVDNDAKDVKALLRSVPGSAAERKAAAMMFEFYGACDNNGTAKGSLEWRDRAEIAYAALAQWTDKGMPDLAAAAAAPGWAFDLGTGKVAGTDYSPSAVGMRMFGDCIVRAAPQAAGDLARSAAGSEQERRAIAALAPMLAPCAPGGQKMRIKRENLRLIVAEPLYHLLGK